jgi:hypothetical protein
LDELAEQSDRCLEFSLFSQYFGLFYFLLSYRHRQSLLAVCFM